MWYDRYRPKSSVPGHWRKQVFQVPYYAPSCFSFSMLGVLVGFYREELTTKLPCLLPWTWMAALLILQGVASFMADVYSLAKSSWWHLVDALQASFLVGIYTEVMIFGLSHGSLRGSLQLLCAAAGYLGAFVAFMRSRGSRKGADASAARYAFWHSLWHFIFPASSSGVVLISVHVPGDAPPGRSPLAYMAFILACMVVGLLWAVYNSFISRSSKGE